MPLTWDDSYETGNQRIDNQHKKLFELTNRLERMIDGKEPMKPVEVIEYLDGYANIHFCYEETCMSMSNCPTQQLNRDAHERFMTLFETMKQRFAKEGTTIELVRLLQKTIADWIVKHICKIDVALRDCAKV